MAIDPTHATHRDTIVIGASAGGVDAVPRLIAQLPAEVRASVLVAQHMAPSSPSYFVDIVRRSASLAVTWAEQGERLEYGHVYIAPPDVHLLLTDGHNRLSSGPRENHARPSIDRLFRSAAAHRGPRVIGVLLTGMMEDGVAGLRAVQEAGGLALVQHPDDAAYPELPSRALQTMEPDRVLPLDALGALLDLLTSERTPHSRVPEKVALEAELDRIGAVKPDMMDQLGEQASQSCPECGGPLWEIGDEKLRRYRCYLGHVATAREMMRDNADNLEAALWSAVRSLHDRATTYETLAQDAQRLGRAQLQQLYGNRAKEARAQADLARNR